MKTFAAAMMLILVAIAFAGPGDQTSAEVAPRFMAVWTQDGETQRREPVCSRIVPGVKPDTVTVVNTCGRCLRFTVARTNTDGSVNAKEFTMQPNKGRNFRVIPNSKITVDSERDCPE